MFSRLAFLLLTIYVPLAIASQPRVADAPDQVKSQRYSSSPLCANSKSAISESQALSIAKTEIQKRIGADASRDYSQFLVNPKSGTVRWSVIAMPESRVIDAHITVLMNKCGKVMEYRIGS
jgi:hypothetical protein